MKKRILFLCLTTFLLMISCKKEDDKETITGANETAARDLSTMLAYYLDAVKVAEDIMDSNYGARIAANNVSCTGIVIDSTSTYKTYTISFTDSCSDYDGYLREGDLIVTVTNSADKKYNVAGAITTITFDNFLYRNARLLGSITMECISESEYTISLTGDNGNGYAEIYRGNDSGRNITLRTSILRTTVTNAGDGYLLNNEYELSGADNSNDLGELKSSEGDSYDVTFSENLRHDNSCYQEGFGRYPVSGIFSLSSTSDDTDVFDLNYGSENCDNKVTLSKSTITKDVTY